MKTVTNKDVLHNVVGMQDHYFVDTFVDNIMRNIKWPHIQVKKETLYNLYFGKTKQNRKR